MSSERWRGLDIFRVSDSMRSSIQCHESIGNRFPRFGTRATYCRNIANDPASNRGRAAIFIRHPLLGKRDLRTPKSTRI